MELIDLVLNSKHLDMEPIKDNCSNCIHSRPAYNLPVHFQGYINCAEDPKRITPVEEKAVCNFHIRK